MKFSEQLKAAREEAGMTRKKLSDEAFIPIRTLEDWEAERRTPPAYVQYLVLDWIRNKTK